MKSNNLLFSVAASALMATFAACSNDLNDVADSSSNIRFTSKVIDGVATRGGTALQTSALESGVQVGLFSSDISGVDNVALTAGSNGSLTYSETLKWPTASTTPSFYAYAPYSAENAGKIDDNISFSVQSDQSTNDNYLKSDLLYASKTNAEYQKTVELGFTHKLSKIIVKLAASTSTTISQPSISLTNVVKDVTLGVKDGKVETGTSAPADVKVGTFSAEASTFECAAVIAPQTVEKDTKFIKIEMNDKTYTCSLKEAKTFASGSVYTITVSFDGEAADIVATSNLTAWNSESEFDLSTEEVISYKVGDYLLADGSFIQKANVANATSDVIGVIFSTDVSETDKANYDAYILYIGGTLSDAAPQSSGTLSFGDSYIVNESLTAAAADLDGLTQTKYVQSQSESSTNFPLYDLSALSNAKPTSGTFSDWFIPSIGQLIQIVNNLGNAGVPTTNTNKYYCVMPNNTGDDTGTISFGGKTFYYTKTPGLTALKSALKVATNNTEIIGSKMYATSSYIKNTSAEVALLAMSNGFMSGNSATDENKKDAWGISSGGATNSRGRVACIAAKLQ
jgi:hypothetical protein